MKRNPVSDFAAAAYDLLATHGAVEFWYSPLEDGEYGIGFNPNTQDIVYKAASEQSAKSMVFLLNLGLQSFRHRIAWKGLFVDRPRLPDGSPSVE